MNKIKPIKGIIKKILTEKSHNETNILQYFSKAESKEMDYVEFFIEEKLISSEEFVVAIKEFLPVTEIFEDSSLTSIDVSTLPKTTIPEEIIKKYHFLTIEESNKKITIVTSNPFNQQMIDDIKFYSGKLTVECLLANYSKLKTIIDKYLAKDYGITNNFNDSELDEMVIQDTNSKDDNDQGADEAPIVRFVNKVLLDAINIKASDVHFEPYEKFYRIRFRIDGILREFGTQVNVSLSNRIAARLKVMSNMDIAEKRKPQDGRIKIKVSRNQTIDFRVNTLPTLFGEKIVLRILDPTSAKLGIDALGYEKDQKELYLEALEKPQGMILVTGPTGSGKTVSLYTGLNILNTSEINISTAEDPVEINLPGINQVNINIKSGMTFSNALRSFLRQDPDVIMVGEIRDLETAEIAIKAAQTGHMVMSTLHTNSASETLTRLRNMGVPSFNIATSVNLIIAQRLARKLCPHCKLEHDVPDNALIGMGFKAEELGFKLYKANTNGCDKCTKGYRGRIGVYEVVKITPKLSKLIMEDANALKLSETCREEGFNDLRRSALIKVKNGFTSLEEVTRITTE